MAKKYKFMRVDVETLKNFNAKAAKMNSELKKLGLPPRIKTINITKMVSQKPLLLDVRELVKLSKRSIKRI